MVKIRLRRIGTKGRPFYRVVVAKSTAGRNGAFKENLGTYDPVAQPTIVTINEERALYWLRQGAEPSETTAYLLNSVGVLPKFFDERPKAKLKYKFLDKRTAAISVKSHETHHEMGAEPVAKLEPAVEEVPATAEAPVETEAAAESTTSETPESSLTEQSESVETGEPDKTNEQ